MRFYIRARLLSVAVVAVAWIAASGVPASADDVSATRNQAKTRSTTSLTLANPAAPASTPARGSAGFTNGFVYGPGVPVSGINGRFNVGKSGVYVPYYGNVGNDPSHPNLQGGVAGIGYGFRTWDISVVSGGLSQTPAVPGVDAPKANPSLTFSIRF